MSSGQNKIFSLILAQDELRSQLIINFCKHIALEVKLKSIAQLLLYIVVLHLKYLIETSDANLYFHFPMGTIKSLCEIDKNLRALIVEPHTRDFPRAHPPPFQLNYRTSCRSGIKKVTFSVHGRDFLDTFYKNCAHSARTK